MPAALGRIQCAGIATRFPPLLRRCLSRASQRSCAHALVVGSNVHSGIDCPRDSVARYSDRYAAGRNFRGAEWLRFSDACQVAQTIFGRSCDYARHQHHRFWETDSGFLFRCLSPGPPPLKESLGGRGKRIEIAGKSATSALDATLTVEVYDEFPSVSVSATVRNAATATVSLDTMDIDAHRFNASSADPTAAPNQLWSFHGASIQWGKDNVLEVPKKFSQEMGWAQSSK